ncbi:MAG: pilus assembly protein TadG-related protein [Sphingomonas sp.]|uniref:TadE/TadG family type IV pilus assembly protein n=1 Tax=Sphingomonas sp. TaxID=28214 RepID=UPI003F7DE21F
MFGLFSGRLGTARTFMGRLRHDVRGNTLAMMAIALIPISALVGSGVDTARLYMVKVRLQQACDAGVLAGRKAMAVSGATTLDTDATNQANTFFRNNFTSGWMKTSSVSFTPSKTADNQVSGVAQATAPMSVMKMFGMPDVTLNVTCQARYDIADTDVMFVLDTTGSMACTTADDPCGASAVSYTRPDGTIGYHAVEESGSKISGLRSAVLNFYDTIAANVDPSTHIRYGFVTYTSTVNAGYAVTAVSPDYVVNSWTYPSRSITVDANNGSSSTTNYTNTSSATCSTYAGRTPATGYTTSGTATVKTVTWTSSSNGTCAVKSQPVKPTWRYQNVTYDTSQYKTGTAVTDPSKITGATSTWQGCLEERDTTASSSFDVSNLPPDLDPDLIPSSDSTRWRPMWPDVVYYRGNNSSIDYAGNGSTPYGDYKPTTDGPTTTYTNMIPYAANGWASNMSSGYVSCGKPVSRLAVMTRDQVNAYLTASDFVPQGGTYHDTGMIWGTRMISPNGIFAADTAAWPGRNDPNRYIVFMTDGDMAPNYNIYGMYGMEYYAKRVTGTSGLSNDLSYHNARFVAECSAAKARGITVFVVGFGQTLTTQLQACASPGQAYYASDNASLNTAFQSIAKQVALLRISQ